MKKMFSSKWKSSKQPRKQRKYRINSPIFIKHKFLNAHLSKELRKKYGKRNLPLRKGDEVLVVRGTFKKKKAKVASVDHHRTRATLEGIQRTKKDGTKVPVVFNPRALQIITLNTDDKRRLSSASSTEKTSQGEKNASHETARHN